MISPDLQPGRPRRPGAGIVSGPDPYPILLRASLLLALAPGFGLGLVLLLALALRRPVPVDGLALAQVHGQVQALGFVGLFILGVATVLLPRFLASPLRRPGRSVAGGLALAAGLVLRSVVQPLPTFPGRGLALGLSAALELGGLLLYAMPMLDALRTSVQPRQMWHVFLGTAFAFLLAALVLNVAGMARLALEAESAVPAGLNEAIVHLELWGFVVPVVLAVSLRILPNFLLLRPPMEPAIRPAFAAYVGGVLVVALAWLVQYGPSTGAQAALTLGWSLMLAGLVGLVWAFRLYEPGSRASGMPHVTYPTRTWVRAAYAWALGATLLGVLLAARPLLSGVPPSFTEASAQRHALTMGFIVVMIVAMAARILPVYSGWTLYHLRLLWLMVGLLLAGALLRVSGEFLGGYATWAAPMVALGGALGFLGFVLFAATLWPTLGRRSASPPR